MVGRADGARPRGGVGGRFQVLVVSRDEELRAQLRVVLDPGVFSLEWCEGVGAAQELLEGGGFQVVVACLESSDLREWSSCMALDPSLALVLLCERAAFDVATAALRLGASDLLVLPCQPARLANALTRALERRQARLDRLRELREQVGVCQPGRCPLLRDVRQRLREEHVLRREGEAALARWQVAEEAVPRLPRLLAAQPVFEGIVGTSPPVQALCRELARAARCDAPVLICGETGAGKELAAQAIHAQSARASGPCVAFNCAAVPEGLLESELFGHRRGAFTDARQERPGLLQRADGGTLFLDEVGDMPLGTQAKLLRALQERRVRPVGSDQEVPVDLRLIAATHHDLEAAARAGRFREDLLYRLNVIRIDVPPLRVRGQDVLLLAQHHLERYAAAAGRTVTGFSPEVAERLLAYPWPGNVRELANCIQRAVAMTEGERIEVQDLPRRLRRRAGGGALEGSSAEAGALLPLQQLEREHVARVLEQVGGNKAEAARILGVSRRTLYRKLDASSGGWSAAGPGSQR